MLFVKRFLRKVYYHFDKIKYHLKDYSKFTIDDLREITIDTIISLNDIYDTMLEIDSSNYIYNNRNKILKAIEYNSEYWRSFRYSRRKLKKESSTKRINIYLTNALDYFYDSFIVINPQYEKHYKSFLNESGYYLSLMNENEESKTKLANIKCYKNKITIENELNEIVFLLSLDKNNNQHIDINKTNIDFKYNNNQGIYNLFLIKKDENNKKIKYPIGNFEWELLYKNDDKYIAKINLLNNIDYNTQCIIYYMVLTCIFIDRKKMKNIKKYIRRERLKTFLLIGILHNIKNKKY